jgi:CheY-like chemotaxis protein
MPDILLVEDYQPNILVATTLLEQFGFACDVATNGTQALERIRNHPYKVILMDVEMPEMNGFETTRRVRLMEEELSRQATPIVAMTAYALAGDRERCLAAGMTDYLSKPFNPEELRDKITGYMNGHAS